MPLTPTSAHCPPSLPPLPRLRYADPAVHRAYMALLLSRPDLSKACNGVILYGLCKCDRATGLAAVRRLSELPEAWTSAARVNASAFLYQKVRAWTVCVCVEHQAFQVSVLKFKAYVGGVAPP